MNILIRAMIGCGVVAAASLAVAVAPQSRLTVQRLLQLTAPSSLTAPQSYRVEISSIGKISLPSNKPEGEIALLREAAFPTEFDPPQPTHAGGALGVIPSTPTKFENIPAGWTVRLTAKPRGKLVAISGAADFREVELVPAGYGEVAAPVYTDRGDAVVTSNVMNMAKVQTTTTHFQLFAVPGETYEVTLYRGSKAEKHRVSVTAD